MAAAAAAAATEDKVDEGVLRCVYLHNLDEEESSVSPRDLPHQSRVKRERRSFILKRKKKEKREPKYIRNS